jgi:hypothetical protein
MNLYSFLQWTKLVFPDDMWIVEDGWKVLLADKKIAQTQFRLKKKSEDGDGNPRQAWAQG